MCLAIPGKVVEIGKDNFVINYGSENREAIMSVVEDLKIGDYVIVSNKIIITEVPMEQAKKYLELVNNKMLEEKMEESYEGMLFRYGISCAENLVALGKITKSDYDKLMDYHKRGEIPSKDFVENVFAAAVERIGDEKTPEAVDKYFRERHNTIIDNREGTYAIMPDVMCEACKIREGEIIGIDNHSRVKFPIYRVRCEKGEDIAFGKYYNDFKIGDRIIIHNKSAVRKLN